MNKYLKINTILYVHSTNLVIKHNIISSLYVNVHLGK